MTGFDLIIHGGHVVTPAGVLAIDIGVKGGNLQLLDEAGNSYIAPRKRGTVILIDSRTQHRVLKVTKGTRKSLVGWTVGKRWR